MAKTSNRIVTVPLVLACALLVGCTQEQLHQTPEQNMDHFVGEVDAFFHHGNWRQTPAPMESYAERIALDHRLLYPAGNVSLTAEGRKSLHGFLREARVRSHESIRLDGPRDAGGQFDSLTAARLADLRQEIEQTGLVAEIAGAAISSPTPLNSDQVAIVVTRTMVMTPDCDRPQPELYDRADYTWSCSTASNLGHMVANPDDLIGDNQVGPADGTVSAATVSRYRKGETKPLNVESTQ